ncbi:MAG: sugar ABC transporter substrate-binding protein [Anaerolineae bacterium]|nr:sugar ABC transporter substrate-binding protein [Anaerolineae bacterium]
MFRKYTRKEIGRFTHTGVLLLLLLAPTACSCGREGALPAEPVTITFDYPDAEAAYYEELIAEFNEIYPQVTIVDVEDYRDDDDPNPDVFFVSPFGLSDLLEQEAILSVNPLIQQDGSFNMADYYPAAVELFSRDDKLWAVPAGFTMIVLYYNKDLFDQYGVPYPQPGWTWDDFVDTTQALRDPGDDVFGYGDVDQFFDPLIFIYLHGGSIVDDMQNPTRMTYDDPKTIEALEWYAALMHDDDDDVIPDRSQLYDLGGSVITGVYLNKVAMWMDWIDVRGGTTDPAADWAVEWKMRWGMVPVPHGEQAVIPMTTNGYAISSDTAYPETCWEWISFLQDQIRVPFNMIPARRSLAESDEYRALVSSDVVDVAQASMQDAMPLPPALFDFIDFNIYGTAIYAIGNGNITPQEALTRAQEQAEAGE